MATVATLVGKVREDLGFPDRDALRESQILQKLYEHNQRYVNQMKLTQESWLLRRFTLTVTTSSDTYPILTAEPTATDFAGAFLVETDPTYYTTTEKRREVTIVNYQNADLVEPRSKVATTSDGDGEVDTVTAISFVHLDGAWKAITFPRGAAGRYRVYYEPGAIADAGLTAELSTLPPFHHMVALATELSVLPLCRWSAQDAAEQGRLRADLAGSISRDLKAWVEVWDRYRYQSHDEQPTSRLSFGRHRRAASRRSRLLGF
jgi:hypothetical protein